MSSQSGRAARTLRDIARAHGPYPEQAYHFIREGLDHAANLAHGPMTPEQHLLAQYVVAEKIGFEEVAERYARGELDASVAAAIGKAGGLEKLNRNVSGESLCWALREVALRRWGGLARLVLRSWNITRTDDFGNMVFTLVEHDLMQKDSRDSMDHFKAVYDFEEAFDRSFQMLDAQE